jgi:hypothetical protein
MRAATPRAIIKRLSHQIFETWRGANGVPIDKWLPHVEKLNSGLPGVMSQVLSAKATASFSNA